MLNGIVNSKNGKLLGKHKKSYSDDRGMNRALRNQRTKGCMFRKHGGGYGMGAPLMAIPGDDFVFSPKVPVNQAFDDCAFPTRPGQIVTEYDVSLAQAAMAGGKRTYRNRKQKHNRKEKRTRRKIHGGVYAVDTSLSVGGTGPNVAPVYATVPCDARAGALSASVFNPDLRAPTNLYSITPNQTGGSAYSAFPGVSGAPGSLIPVYNAPVAGFTFVPSNAAGAPLPAGVAVYNEVVPQIARVGGKRKNRTRRNRSRKHRNVSRKH
jgi:hypothetical protein